VNDPSTFLSTHELLLELRRHHGLTISYATLWRAIIAGDVPSERVPGGYRFLRSDIREIAGFFGTPKVRGRRSSADPLPPAA
jgi:hypothetical protein